MRDKSSTQLAELHPNQIVRKRDGSKFFGLKNSALEDAIKAKEIPAPFPLTESGRATGWTGAQILEHHRQRMAAAAVSGRPRSAVKRTAR